MSIVYVTMSIVYEINGDNVHLSRLYVTMSIVYVTMSIVIT